ncbi:hypothetical protein SAMN00120144_1321 [Hymenobacter roseosalivarius DSM 11622]|uniref:Uncharacterized protein n=1 Tax=Hymenobacter roseosalivarius DSM 11622 TaxID=645990 RepID=A0A1W1W4M2_9BACT|nr:hypothetical protein SAMN00120144_1321 [Hymenobacter roseosalivarius DSM 11622]
MREAQLAKHIPLRKNTAATAILVLCFCMYKSGLAK